MESGPLADEDDEERATRDEDAPEYGEGVVREDGDLLEEEELEEERPTGPGGEEVTEDELALEAERQAQDEEAMAADEEGRATMEEARERMYRSEEDDQPPGRGV
jgi:hypothetical protein